MNINHNNAPEGDTPKQIPVFKNPFSFYSNRIMDIAESAKGQWTPKELALPRPGLPLNVLRSNLLQLGTNAFDDLEELVLLPEATNKLYTPQDGPAQFLKLDRVQVTPAFALFAMNALALLGAEKQDHDLWPVMYVPEKNIYVMGETDTPDTSDNLRDMTWQDAGKALSFCASFAESVFDRTEGDFIINLDDAQETASKIVVAERGLAWVREQFDERALEVLKERQNEMEGYAKILGLPVPARVETFGVAVEAQEVEDEPHADMTTGELLELASSLTDEEEARWEQCKKALTEASQFVSMVLNGDALNTTAMLNQAAGFHKALSLVKASVPMIEAKWGQLITHEVRANLDDAKGYKEIRELQ
jgi:hypothetical protein